MSLLVYFAGPDVFRPDYPSVVSRVRALCAESDLIPLLPEASASDPRKIFADNVELIRAADGVIANLNPFRGPLEPDSGTVFEVGLAYGLGKWIVAYLSDGRDVIDKIRETPLAPDPQTPFLAADGSIVEDMGLPLNLMPAMASARVCRDLAEAVRAARALAAPAR
ncbi:MAG: nucleoside 2-deoxyribosyltransferase [Deltaproteobacteria bacterium]|jgi:nucleoside deoxyribosyltransferase|nr:nucleoside 2-deoxyribosyltransferase [Deltaproteobacteria bacterium]